MIKISNTKLVSVSIILFGYYLFIAYKLFHGGIFSNEGLFFAEKTALLSEGNEDAVKIVGLTFPEIPFVISSVLSAFSANFAPFLASALGTTILFFLISRSVREQENFSWLFLGIIMTFTLHPAFLFMAVSGKSSYLALIFFYRFMLNLFRYFKNNTSYHISVASIYFSLLIFSSSKFSWLILFILPVIFFTALQSMKIAKHEPLEKIAFAFNSISIRRKLVSKTMAVYLMIFALPITLIFAFRLLNAMYTGDANYYLDSPYANSNSIINQTENFDGFLKDRISYFLPEVSFLTSLRILIFAPALIFCLTIFKSKGRNIFIVFSLFFFMEFLKLKYPDIFIPTHYYAAFICLCWAFIENAESVRDVRFSKQIYLLLIIGQILIGYMMLSSSFITEEKKYVLAFNDLMLNKPLHVDDDVAIARYIQKLKLSDQILADDATSYRLIALTKSTINFLTPGESRFLAAFEQPENHVSYILATRKQSQFDSFNLLNHSMIIQLRQKRVTVKPVCSNKNYTLYKIIK